MPPGSYPREASIIWSKRVNKSLSNYSFNRISESRSICSVQLSCQIVCVYYEILTKVTLFYRRPGGKWEISSFLYIQGDPFSKCESGSKLFLSLTCWELERKRKARIIFPCPFIFFFSHPWKHINYFFYPVTLFIFPCLKRRGKKIILPENSITLGITKEKKSYSHMKKKPKTFPCFFLSFLFFSPFFLFYLFSQIELGKIIFAKTLFTSSWVINTGEVTISIKLG